MPLLQALWSPVERMQARHVPVVEHDDDLALGWECALPALQLDAWDPLPAAVSEQPVRAAS